MAPDRARSTRVELAEEPALPGLAEATIGSGTGAFVVAREGGRIKSLTPEDGLPNVLFAGTSSSTGVRGGDRLWPAPEVDIFYPDGPVDLSRWRCPPELDPGTWTMTIGTDVKLVQFALGASFERRISALSEPPVACDLPWSGYRVVDRLRGVDTWSAWHVVMVDAPKRIVVPRVDGGTTYYPPVPTMHRGWIEASGLPPRWKAGFAPPRDGQITMAALDPTEIGSLVMLMTTAPSNGTYVDVPPGGGQATVAQVYNSAGEGFCELEHHGPLETKSTDAVVFGAWGSMPARLGILGALGVRR